LLGSHTSCEYAHDKEGNQNLNIHFRNMWKKATREAKPS
jgi:hypothetical protein